MDNWRHRPPSIIRQNNISKQNTKYFTDLSQPSKMKNYMYIHIKRIKVNQLQKEGIWS